MPKLETEQQPNIYEPPKSQVESSELKKQWAITKILWISLAPNITFIVIFLFMLLANSRGQHPEALFSGALIVPSMVALCCAIWTASLLVKQNGSSFMTLIGYSISLTFMHILFLGAGVAVCLVVTSLGINISQVIAD